MKTIIIIIFTPLIIFGHTDNFNKLQSEFKELKDKKENEIYLKIGFNYTSFTREIEGFHPGFILGIGFDKYINRKINLSSELTYSTKGAYLKNKIIKFYYMGEYMGRHVSDINCHIGYIDIPFLLKYNIINNIKISCGFGISVAVKDYSKETYLFTLTDNENIDVDKLEYDYLNEAEPEPYSFNFITKNSGFFLSFGILLTRSRFSLEMKYNYSLYKVDFVEYSEAIALEERMQGFQFSVSYYL